MSENESQRMTVDDSEVMSYPEWRQALEERTLLGLECQNCESRTATPKRACANCGSRDLETIELPTTGGLYSQTEINVPPDGFDGTYRVGIVALGDVKVMARIETGADIGDEVTFSGVLDEGDLPAPVFE